jgi:hypothetical protein
MALKKGRLIFPGNFSLKPPRTFAGILNSGSFPKNINLQCLQFKILTQTQMALFQELCRQVLPTCQFPGLRLPQPFRPRVLNLLLVIPAVCLIEQLLQLLNTLLVNGKVGETPCPV